MRNALFLLSVCAWVGCKQAIQKQPPPMAEAAPVKVAKAAPPVSKALTSDTLVFLSFNGDFDYWYADFLRAPGDTIKLVTDEELQDTLLGKRIAVEWKLDTLYEAGDGDTPYQAKRLVKWRVVSGAVR